MILVGAGAAAASVEAATGEAFNGGFASKKETPHDPANHTTRIAKIASGNTSLLSIGSYLLI